MNWSNCHSKLRGKISIQNGRILLTRYLIICIVASGIVIEAKAQTVNDIVTQPGIDAIEYYVHQDDSGWTMNTVSDIDFGEGGNFGSHLYFMDNSLSERGRLYRLMDITGDGDALDTSESSYIEYPFGRRPHAMVFGDGSGSFGTTDLFLVDDGPNQIYRLNTFSTSYSIFSSGYVTPSEAEFTPDGNGMLILETSNFTGFGGGADGLIYILDQFGNKSIWAHGGNIPHGLYDINTQSAMSPDGWLTFLDHSITSSGLSQLVQFRDNNSDGDADDSGEGRVIIPTQAGTVAGVIFRQGIAINSSNGDMYIGASDSGFHQILKFVDVNGDGDFWDSSANAFDAGEKSVFADDMPGIVLALGFSPAGDLFAGATNWWDFSPRKGFVVRFTTSTAPPCTTPVTATVSPASAPANTTAGFTFSTQAAEQGGGVQFDLFNGEKWVTMEVVYDNADTTGGNNTLTDDANPASPDITTVFNPFGDHGGFLPAGEASMRVMNSCGMTAHVFFTLEPAFADQTLEGTVYDRDTLVPVPFAGVFAENTVTDERSFGFTNPDGTFTLQIPSPGNYEIEASYVENAYISTPAMVMNIPPGGLTGLELYLIPADAQITGSFREYGTGNPVWGAEVDAETVDDKDFWAVTDIFGNYILNVLSGIEWNVEAEVNNVPGFFGIQIPSNNYENEIYLTPTQVGPNTVDFTAHEITKVKTASPWEE
jgi:hypothetical protein